MKLIITIAAVFFLQACTKPSKIKGSSQAPSSTGAITGKWNWVKSEGGVGFRVLTPANTGDHLQIEFKNDGTVNYFKNDELQFSGAYTIETTIDSTTGDSQLVITQNYFGVYPQPENQVLQLDPGNMNFDEGGADRFVHFYQRAGISN